MPFEGGEGVAGDDLGGDLADAAAAGAGGLAEAVEGAGRVELLALHQDALGLLDHDPVVEGVLELVDDLGGALGLGGRPDQGGDHAGVGEQGLDLLGLPGPVRAADRRERAGGAGRALDRDAEQAVHAGQLGPAGQGGPAALAGQVGGADGRAAGQDLDRRAGPELRGGLLQGLGEVAGGDRPACSSPVSSTRTRATPATRNSRVAATSAGRTTESSASPPGGAGTARGPPAPARPRSPPCPLLLAFGAAWGRQGPPVPPRGPDRPRDAARGRPDGALYWINPGPGLRFRAGERRTRQGRPLLDGPGRPTATCSCGAPGVGGNNDDKQRDIHDVKAAAGWSPIPGLAEVAALSSDRPPRAGGPTPPPWSSDRPPGPGPRGLELGRPAGVDLGDVGGRGPSSRATTLLRASSSFSRRNWRAAVRACPSSSASTSTFQVTR